VRAVLDQTDAAGEGNVDQISCRSAAVLPVQETSPANPALPQQGAGGSGAGGSGIAEEDCHMAEVDAANENGHFARWGEAAPQRRGELAGTHLRNGVQMP
jgi:hypothetical protein